MSLLQANIAPLNIQPTNLGIQPISQQLPNLPSPPDIGKSFQEGRVAAEQLKSAAATRRGQEIKNALMVIGAHMGTIQNSITGATKGVEDGTPIAKSVLAENKKKRPEFVEALRTVGLDGLDIFMVGSKFGWEIPLAPDNSGKAAAMDLARKKTSAADLEQLSKAIDAGLGSTGRTLKISPDGKVELTGKAPQSQIGRFKLKDDFIFDTATSEFKPGPSAGTSDFSNRELDDLNTSFKELQKSKKFTNELQAIQGARSARVLLNENTSVSNKAAARSLLKAMGDSRFSDRDVAQFTGEESARGYIRRITEFTVGRGRLRGDDLKIMLSLTDALETFAADNLENQLGSAGTRLNIRNKKLTPERSREFLRTALGGIKLVPPVIDEEQQDPNIVEPPPIQPSVTPGPRIEDLMPPGKRFSPEQEEELRRLGMI